MGDVDNGLPDWGPSLIADARVVADKWYRFPAEAEEEAPAWQTTWAAWPGKVLDRTSPGRVVAIEKATAQHIETNADRVGAGVAEISADKSIMSDALPDGVEDGQQYAQARPPGRRLGGGRELTPVERMNEASFHATLNAIRQLEPKNPALSYVAGRDWVPEQRDVARVQEELIHVRQRAADGGGIAQTGVAGNGFGIGPYAGESIPARSVDQYFRLGERSE